MNNDPTQPGSDELRSQIEPENLNVREVHGAILREKDDPRDGYEPIPLWMVSLFMALVFWGGAYLAFYSGGFRADVFDPSRVAWTGGGAVQDAGPPDPMVVGRRLFTANCVACHQATGQGVPGQFPTLVDSEWVVGGGWVGDNHLIKIMLHGLQGPITVKGAPYNGAMPPWTHLSDDQIAAILTYIRNEWGNSAPPITAEMVAQIREETADVREPFTQPKLQAIPAVWFEQDAGDAAPADESGEPEEAGDDNGIAPGDGIPDGDAPVAEDPATAV